MKHQNASDMTVSALSCEIFRMLAERFPVACSSDEFYFFPHIRLNPYPWHQWDDFSPENISDVNRLLDGWVKKINAMKKISQNDTDRVDCSLLEHLCKVLQEQLNLVRTWQRQPSFYLMIANIGLAEALAADDISAGRQRASGLPAFLEQAVKNLTDVPALFAEIGKEMVVDTQKYYVSLQSSLPALSLAKKSLAKFAEHLGKIPFNKTYLLPADLTERIFEYHLNTELGVSAIRKCLDAEINAMQLILHQNWGKSNWQKRIQQMAAPDTGKGGVIGLYKDEIERLLGFCLKKQLIPPGLNISCPVHVTTVPAYMQAIRAASSYSIIPDYPPGGGTFSVLETDQSSDTLREYRMLSAHEIYPGHHLLDAARLNLVRPVRRHVESPLFYEGWACFAEELLWQSGYFSTPDHRLLLAKRRFWRAMRGKIDLELQLGMMDLTSAVALLKKTGRSDKNILSTVKKYILNPGYQTCYTVGLANFLDLNDRYGQNQPARFVNDVLSQGEIGFANLANYFNSTPHN